MCPENCFISWKAALGHAFVMWTLALLLEARICQATCQEQQYAGTFDIPCICLNSNCAYRWNWQLQPHCQCDDGQDVPEAELGVALMEMRNRGEALESVYISGWNLTSLEPFEGYLEESMAGSFVVEHTSITSMQSLDVLRDVDLLAIQYNGELMQIPMYNFRRLEHVGTLRIFRNGELVDVTGFENLREVGSHLHIAENGNLARISGFGNLIKVKFLWIQDSPRLWSIPEFGRLKKVKYIRISSINNLESIGGFGNLVNVSSTMEIVQCSHLRSISGFGRIRFLAANLALADNGALEKVDGFQSLRKVDGNLWIWNNPSIRDISGLHGLRNVTGGVAIVGNGLQNIGWLSNLTEIGSDLACIGNSALQNLDGLKNIKVIKRDITIMSNTQLHNVDGLKNVKEVPCNLSILSNNGLKNVNGLRNIAAVGGDLTIRGNIALKNVNGLDGLVKVAGNFKVEKNGNLMAISQFQNLKQVGRDLVISGNLQDNSVTISWGENGSVTANAQPPMMDGGSLNKLRNVGHNLILSDIEFRNTKGKLMPKLKSINGSLVLQRSVFDNAVMLRNLESVLGSLRIIGNEATYGTMLNMFQNLKTICGNASSAPGCGLEVKDNVGIKVINFFSHLSLLNGSLSISNNVDLKQVTGFSNLQSVTKWRHENGGVGDLFGGFVITSNPNLASLDGFGRLTNVTGDLVISNNEALNHIDLGNLSVVTNLTRITANGNLTHFASEEPLPYKQSGCRKRENAVPCVNGSTMLVTLLEMDKCKVERLIPTIVGFAIIGAMIVLSMMLFHYMMSNFQSPYHPRRPMDELMATFAAHLLALADVLSDVGFVITAFILWKDKSAESIEGGKRSQENKLDLFIILVLSILVILGTQLYIVIAVFWGLMSKKVGSEINSEVPIFTLYQYLLSEKAMRKRDWLLLFPGLLVFDAEVIKHLPWGSELTCNDDNKAAEKKAGFVHQHFARVAFLAGLLEDLPQMAIQIAFMYVIEEDDGWAITGAMASLTLSVADIMVKFVFPGLIKMLPARHLTRDVGFKSSVYDCSTSLLEDDD